MNQSRLHTIQNLKENPLKFSDLIYIARNLAMNQKQMCLLANISPRAFKSKPPSAPLSFQMSERVLLLQELYEVGLDIFDSKKDSLRDWLQSKVPALDNNVPNDLLTSLLGIDVIKEELLRIENGVY